MSNLIFASACQLAQMIRDREVSAVEVLDAHLDQIAKHNSKLNVICTLNEEQARQRAKQADEDLGDFLKIRYRLLGSNEDIPFR